MSRSSSARLGAYLAEQAAAIRELEAKAEQELHGTGGQKGYERLMRQKAELLRDLADNALEQSGVVEDELSADVSDRLRAFSESAAMSLQIGSVFFMSALLYPEDHRPGSPNDLEVFARRLG